MDRGPKDGLSLEPDDAVLGESGGSCLVINISPIAAGRAALLEPDDARGADREIGVAYTSIYALT
jgi:hypothetical protein